MRRCCDLAGFEAFPVLIEPDAKKDPEVPQPYFGHAITAVRHKDGSYILMDSTDESTRRLLPSYLDNKSYLVASPEGDPLRTSPIVPAAENMLQHSHDRTPRCLGHAPRHDPDGLRRHQRQ